MRPKLSIEDRLSETVAVKFTVGELAKINVYCLEKKYSARTQMFRELVLKEVDRWEKRKSQNPKSNKE